MRRVMITGFPDFTMLMHAQPFTGEQTQEDQATLGAEVALLRATVGMLRSRLSEMERLADTDTLTPLLNRRAFLRELNRAIQAKARHGVDAGLLYIDMDRLKAINDGHGHSAGDAAILHVAHFLKNRTRLTDVVARIGGDEFAIILTHIDEVSAQAKAKRLVKDLAALPLSFEEGHIGVTIGCGMTMIAGKDDAESTLARADAAMYASRVDEPGSQ